MLSPLCRKVGGHMFEDMGGYEAIRVWTWVGMRLGQGYLRLLWPSGEGGNFLRSLQLFIDVKF